MDHTLPEPDKISGATVLDDLPESIIVWEILVRLPPKDALRCRAVRRSWRRATSTRDFLLAHHQHQPSHPIAVIKHYADGGPRCSDPPRLAVFHGAGGAGDRKLWPFLRCATDCALPQLHASRDGLLLVSGMAGNTVGVSGASVCYSDRFFYVCNPATRQFAALPQLAAQGTQRIYTTIAGLYLHHPSGEYRVLYTRRTTPRQSGADFYITSIGPDEPGRFIGRPPPSSTPSIEQALLKGLLDTNMIPPVLHRGGLHWDLAKHHYHYTAVHDIMVFDTAGETFRWLRRPARAPLGFQTMLLEMDGALTLFSAARGGDDLVMVMDVFVLQDYADEVWVLGHRIRIDLAAANTVWPRAFDQLMVVVVEERQLLIQFSTSRLLHCDIDGKILQIVALHGDQEHHRHAIHITAHSLRQSILPLGSFETKQGTYDGSNDDPLFFLGF